MQPLHADEIKDLNRGRAYLANVADRHNVTVYQNLEAALGEVVAAVRQRHPLSAATSGSTGALVATPAVDTAGNLTMLQPASAGGGDVLDQGLNAATVKEGGTSSSSEDAQESAHGKS